MPESVNVEAAGELGVDDFYRYYVFDLLRRRPWLAVLMVTGAIYLVTFPFAEPLTLGRTVRLLLFVVPLGGALYAFFVQPYYVGKTLLQTLPDLRGPLRYSFTDDGIEFAGPTTQSHLDWSFFVSARETSRQFELYPHKGFATVVPKRFLSDHDGLSSLRALLRAHVPNTRLNT